MTRSIQELTLSSFPTCLPARFPISLAGCERVFRQHQHRVYGLAFWMAANEVAAEEIMGGTFRRAFASGYEPTAEMIDRALVLELRERMPLGTLTLQCAPATVVLNVRRNLRRTDLERVVVQLPATERLIFLLHDVEGYGHDRIAHILRIVIPDSRTGLCQARLRLRELLAGG